MSLVEILLPILAGCALFFVPRTDRVISRASGCVVAAITFLLPLIAGSDGTFAARWLSRPFTASLHWSWGGLAFWMVLLLALCTFCAILATNMGQTRTMAALLLMLEGTMMGVFMARDILAFALFWDLMLIPPFFALVGWGEHRDTAWRYLIYNFSGGLLLLLSTAAFGVLYGSTDVIGTTHQLTGNWAPWIFAGFAIAFAVKTPLFPLHTWMPATYSDSPPVMVSLVSSLQSKAGLFGFLVIGLPFFADAMGAWKWIFIVASLVSLLYGAFIALAQTDAKRIVAYSSLSHLGLIILAIFSQNPIAIQGAFIYIVAHSLFSSALFLILGYIEEREDTRSLVRLGGLGKANPKLAGAFTIAALAALGLPGLAGFVGELVILTGVFKNGYFWPALIALVPIVLASAYMLRLLQDIINGPVREDIPERRDLTWVEGLAVAPLLAALVILGVYPHAVLRAAQISAAPAGRLHVSTMFMRHAVLGAPSLAMGGAEFRTERLSK
jgi:NADH-quinone oxidoreductase subunit M